VRRTLVLARSPARLPSIARGATEGEGRDQPGPAAPVFVSLRRGEPAAGYTTEKRTEPTLFAAIIAGLWMLHPLQTESVTYVVQRAESLMGLLYLFTLYAFVRGTGEAARSPRSPAGDGRDSPAAPVFASLRRGEPAAGCKISVFWFAASALACLLGMATKEVMVSAPVMVLLYDSVFVVGGGLSSIGTALRRRPLYYAALAATWIPLAFLVSRAGGRGGTMGFGIGIPAQEYIASQFGAIAHYLRLVVWPFPQIFDYGSERTIDALQLFPSVLLVSLLASLTVLALRLRPRLGVLGLWFFAILAPTSLVPAGRQTLSEHRMYLALAPVLIVGVVGVLRALRRTGSPARWLFATGVLGGTVCLAVTVRRNRVYRTEVALWADTAAKRPGNPAAQNNLGRALVLTGDIDAARRRFEQAIHLDSSQPDPHSNLGTLLAALGDDEGALRQFQAATQAKPDAIGAHLRLGDFYAHLGRLDEAATQYETVLAIRPGLASAQQSLAIVNAARAKAP